ncbi:uncharacterized protein LOC135118163 [Helicoverpa armigera]|uniref:uncharacterized protein LOC135118163 n=1 Tax=Helicoverpa armigera TaxID=29058 RepID=UPI003082E095
MLALSLRFQDFFLRSTLNPCYATFYLAVSERPDLILSGTTWVLLETWKCNLGRSWAVVGATPRFRPVFPVYLLPQDLFVVRATEVGLNKVSISTKLCTLFGPLPTYLSASLTTRFTNGRKVIKCANESCCSPPRSAFKSVLADTFMPPPCPILQTPSKLVVPSLLDKGTSKFSPLLVRLSVDLSPPLEEFKQMPYDFFCPSVQFDLKKKVCPTCGIYVHDKTVPDHCETRVQPQRLAARRANELLCIMRRYETSSEDADWLDEDEVDASVLTIPAPSSSALQMPVMKESEWLANPWTEEQQF